MSTQNAVVIAWSSIWTTALVTVAQGIVLYWFFKYQRNKEKVKGSFDLYEPRQYTREKRSPPPFEDNWWQAAWSLSQEETLRCVGLDSYMFLRFFRLGARISGVGTALSVILIPVYATGEARGDGTIKFNLLTLARVGQGSNRIWASVFAWFVFIGFILREFWVEWKLYAKNRYYFLAHGDEDMSRAFRYSVRCEQVPNNLRSDDALKQYFERLFPGKVKEAVVFFQTKELQKLIDKRKNLILKLESAIAFTNAKPQKPRPMIKEGGKLCGGTKVDAIEHYEKEIEKLNAEIDAERTRVLSLMERTPKIEEDVVGGNINGNDITKATSTAFVAFTSLRAKQAAIQCELTGNPDSLVVFPASDPQGILWNNVTTPLHQQKVLTLQMAVFWTVGILFWAMPVAFVQSIANLNSILQAIGLKQADPTAGWYGLISGILPVVALAILMAVLYMAIVTVATRVVRFKSSPEVDAYVFYWHQLFQFANLWLILISGSLFNQIDALIQNISSVVKVIANAMPGASVFFVNLILVGSFGQFGLELSMIPAYGVALIMKLIKPEAMQTQRQLDDAKKPPSIVWGKTIPPVVFIFLVIVLYMPIVPIMEVFGFAYFSGSYLVWKHQCLHVYAQEFEGGGEATWARLFGFLMSCLYMSEVVFIAYMGIKEAPTQGILGFIPLGATVLMHVILNRNLIQPLQNLSLEVAADVDINEGELGEGAEDVEKIYAMPALDVDNDERGPMPYRRLSSKPILVENDNDVVDDYTDANEGIEKQSA